MSRAIFFIMAVITIIGIAVISIPAPTYALGPQDNNPDPYYFGNQNNGSNGPNTNCYTYDNRQFCGYQGQTSSFVGYSSPGSPSGSEYTLSENCKACISDADLTQDCGEAAPMAPMQQLHCQDVCIPQSNLQLSYGQNQIGQLTLRK